MKKELIIMISLLVVAMFVVSACSSGEAFKSAEKDALDMKLDAEPSDNLKKVEQAKPVNNTSPRDNLCFDSDNGTNLFVQGFVNASNGVFEDYCNNIHDVEFPVNILEYFCEGDEASFVEAECPEMTYCEEGACKHYCIDTDRGQNYAVQGETTGWNVGLTSFTTMVDGCNDQGLLAERYCDGPILSVEYDVVCPSGYGCYNGVCLEEVIIEFDDNIDLDDVGNSGVNIDDYQNANTLKLSSAGIGEGQGFLVGTFETDTVYIMHDDNNDLLLLAYVDEDGDVIGVEEISFGGTGFEIIVKMVSKEDEAYQVTWDCSSADDINMALSGLFPGFSEEKIFILANIVDQWLGPEEDAESVDIQVREYFYSQMVSIGDYENDYTTGMGTVIVEPEENGDNEEVHLIVPKVFIGPENSTPGDLIIPVLQPNDLYIENLSVETYNYEGITYQVSEIFKAVPGVLTNAGTYHDEEFEPGTLTVTGISEAISLKYLFSPPLEISNNEEFEMQILGQTLNIFDIDGGYSNDVTISVAEEITLQPGESYTATVANMQQSITLNAVNQNLAVVTVDNHTEGILLGENYDFGDITIEVRNILYDPPDNNLAKLAYAPEYIYMTVGDGDSMELFGYGDTANDAEWVWDIETSGSYGNYNLVSLGAKYNQDREHWDDDFVPLLEGDEILLPLTDGMLNTLPDYPLLIYTAHNPDGSITIDITR